MAALHAETRDGGPSRWAGRVARGLPARPRRQGRPHGPRGQGRGWHAQGEPAAPPPIVGLELTPPALDESAGRPSHRVSLAIAHSFLSFSPLEILTGRHKLWYEERKNGCPLETVGVPVGMGWWVRSVQGPGMVRELCGACALPSSAC